MEELIKKMRNLSIDSQTVSDLNHITYTDFDGRTKTGINALTHMGADLGTLNPNE